MSARASIPTDDPGQLAAELVVRLQQAIAVARLHEASNVALDAPVFDLREALSVMLATQGHASLKPEPRAEMLFVNERAVRVKRQQSAALDGLLKTLATLGIGELRVSRALTTPQVKALLTALRLGFASLSSFEALERVRKELEAAELDQAVEVRSVAEAAAVARGRTIRVDDAVAVRLAWARTLALFGDFVEHRRDDELGPYFWRKLGRAVQGLQALAARAPRELLALTAVKDLGVPAHAHAVNTCILALLLGREAELSRTRLAPLGLAALLHGLGKLDLDPALLAKTHGERTEDERRLYAHHPYRAVGGLLAGRQLGGDSLVLSAVVAFQYEAGTGVPETRAPLETIHPLARIVAICEAYDALTMPTPLRPRGLRPDQALQSLLRGEPRSFDFTLLGLLANLLGLYPPGTPVRLESGELAVVVRPSPRGDPHRPVVAVLRDTLGEDAAGATLDLGASLPGGRLPPGIAEAIDEIPPLPALPGAPEPVTPPT